MASATKLYISMQTIFTREVEMIGGKLNKIVKTGRQ